MRASISRPLKIIAATLGASILVGVGMRAALSHFIAGVMPISTDAVAAQVARQIETQWAKSNMCKA